MKLQKGKWYRLIDEDNYHIEHFRNKDLKFVKKSLVFGQRDIYANEFREEDGAIVIMIDNTEFKEITK